jgi:hypothetical protein
VTTLGAGLRRLALLTAPTNSPPISGEVIFIAGEVIFISGEVIFAREAVLKSRHVHTVLVPTRSILRR